MRILNVIGTAQLGGAERVVLELTQELRRRGLHVDILCSPSLAKHYRPTGARIFPSTYGGIGHIAGVLSMALIGSRYDIVHLHGLSASIICSFVPLLKRTKYIVTLHGSEGQMLTSTARDLRTTINCICVRQAVRRATSIIAVSTPLADTFSSSRNRVMVVYNGVNSSLVKSMAMKNRHLTVWLKQLKERGFSCLVFPGRLESRSKGQDVMILAMKKLIDAKVKVCATFTFGPGGERDLQKLQELVRSLGIRHRVFFRQLGPGEQYAYMAEADVIVTHLVQEHTSFEGISQVHLEAGALGKPLVAINSRDMRIFRGLPFLLSSSDPSEVAAKVEYILEHRHEANNRAEGMALIVENEFAWPHVASKYLQIYNDARNANS